MSSLRARRWSSSSVVSRECLPITGASMPLPSPAWKIVGAPAKTWRMCSGRVRVTTVRLPETCEVKTSPYTRRQRRQVRPRWQRGPCLDRDHAVFIRSYRCAHKYDRTVGHRAQLLAAARQLLEDKGYAHITARDLVAASGTNLASIGYHFGSKAGLLNAALGVVFEEWAT